MFSYLQLFRGGMAGLGDLPQSGRGSNFNSLFYHNPHFCCSDTRPSNFHINFPRNLGKRLIDHESCKHSYITKNVKDDDDTVDANNVVLDGGLKPEDDIVRIIRHMKSHAPRTS